ncbi:S28 family serine protease [Streptomyces sp. HNM0574]|uniref:S28 family serine protease n=1 Tax=Streptomyces sp. HNM0574 TaxID=2714954 RepID=UPI00146BAC99|nr:S28 family serine protease [Streptomyces sp. HNM0574]NLU66457.1 aminopeptidase [Streptomyces sp. HNM0574]
MRRALRWLLSFVVLIGVTGVGGSSAGAATAAGTDIKDRILAIPGMSLIEEKPVDGYRFFVLNYEQPVDHRNPDEGTFQQRISLLHKGEDRPTVFYTGGYTLNPEPKRTEPTQMVDGNQVSMEYRYFTPSRPEPADWSKLDIWQAASDQHRIFSALKRVYAKNWISTGASKGGMTATYYRRFYPQDMDGTVAYVAPNDVRNDEDGAYYDFFENVGTKQCRDRLNAAQREIFERRGEMVDRLAKWAKKGGYTFETVGGVDKAFELIAQDLVWGFWQYHLEEKECGDVPTPDASTDALYTWADKIGGWDAGTDQGMKDYVPYYYQAGTQLGSPDYEEPLLDDLRKYPGLNSPRTYVPRDIPMDSFDHGAMKDIDRWVRTRSSEMLFVNGEKDPWRAEPFRVGRGSEDSHVYTAPGANHGAQIAMLAGKDREAATESLLEWAGVDRAAADKGAAPKRLTTYDAELDRPDPRERMLRP